MSSVLLLLLLVLPTVSLKKGVMFLKILLILISAVRSIQGKVYPSYLEEASTFSSSSASYDYIVVGGGTAGCPMAATLSQKYKVLLLERGGSPYGNPNVSYMQNFHISLMDTSPKSPSQAFISTDGVINARARVLGGGTCINAGFYSRASPSFVKKTGWDDDLVNESYPWVEEQIVHCPKVAPWQAAVRDGLLAAGVSPFNGYTYDHVYGTKVGGTIFDHFGFRSTAADLLSAGDHTNLRVLLHATVLKIQFDQSGPRPRAVGVVFKDENGKEHRASLNVGGGKSQVILSAGAIGSPQLLMLSGIGPKSHLKAKNVPVVLHNKFVGKGMSDNPMNSIFIPTKKQVEQSLIQIVGITKFGAYIEASSGFSQSSDSVSCHHGIMSAEAGQLATIPPKERSIEAISTYSEKKKKIPIEAFRGGFILSKISGALSRGHLRLIDTNIDNNPEVTFNYFSHPFDLNRCVHGIQTIAKIVHTEHMTNLTHDDDYTMKMLLNMSVDANVNFIPKHINDTSSLEQFCKDTVITIWHYHGGCQVGKVVDGDYRLLGVDGVMVVDGSTFLESPGTNPQATVLMMGRYTGVKILRERLGSEAGV